MIVMIDNYDSFTYNLVQYVGQMGEDLQVYRNDACTLSELEQLHPDLIIISPGPCTPDDAGMSLDIIRYFAGKIPLFGVCLGHQAIAQAFGGVVKQADRFMHGKTSPVYHDGKSLFADLPSPFEATRYHSLIVEKESLPDCFEISAWTQEGEIMGIRHRQLPLEGVQFHPESIMTVHGKTLIQQCLKQYMPHRT